MSDGDDIRGRGQGASSLRALAATAAQDAAAATRQREADRHRNEAREFVKLIDRQYGVTVDPDAVYRAEIDVKGASRNGPAVRIDDVELVGVRRYDTFSPGGSLGIYAQDRSGAWRAANHLSTLHMVLTREAAPETPFEPEPGEGETTIDPRDPTAIAVHLESIATTLSLIADQGSLDAR